MANKNTTSNNAATESMNYESPMLEHKKSGFINEFLWTCAGVNKAVLRQCPSDYAKYAGIGGTILFTALMAMLSGGYAMFYVFDSTYIAIAFGIFWGLLIFNLDRFIVNTMYSDGKHTISWAELQSGLPRIIMAIFLGLVISTPLEMKIFNDRINSQLVKDNITRTNETRAIADKGNEELVARRNTLEKARQNISYRLAAANKELKEEGAGEALSGKVGHGSIYEDKKSNRDAIQTELTDWDNAHSSELENIKAQIAHNTEKAGKDIERGNDENGFAVRYEAFKNVTDWTEHPSLAIVSLMITLLFVIIETAPTFFKMMMEDGPYDDLLRAEKHRVRVLSQKRISDVNDDVNTSVQISTMKNQKRLEAETLANEDIMKRIATAQSELLQKAISAWREEELKKINENPSAYIKMGKEESTQHS
jgi:hypothetical protein